MAGVNFTSDSAKRISDVVVEVENTRSDRAGGPSSTPGFGGRPQCWFTLTATLTGSDATGTGTVDSGSPGGLPGGTATLYNPPSMTGQRFFGEVGAKGQAVWERNRWVIIQLDCEPSYSNPVTANGSTASHFDFVVG